MLIHDVANPLGIIKANAEIARRFPSLTEKKIISIENNTEHLIAVIKGIREMKAVTDKKITLNLKPSCLRSLIEQTVEFYQDRASQKNIQIKLKLPEYGQANYNVDPAVFKVSILGNLLGNAIKFSNPNSEIDISLFVSETSLVIEITDHGIGIPQKMLSKLFLPNEATSRLGTTGEKGTGYGLMLAKQWTESMNGNISITSVEQTSESNNNHGTSIRIFFSREKKEVAA